jgi:transcription termination factor Rho
VFGGPPRALPRARPRPQPQPLGGDRFGSDAEPMVSDDDVLIPVGGILDILDNYGFVRTTGYLTGPNDVYVSLQQVRKYGLRRGDAVTGAVRQQREGERKDKYNALVRLDSVNGMDPAEAHKRPDFTKLTPLYPQDRLRLETEPGILTTRVIDLVMPVGKGQRALIVSPPKAGKTMVMQAIANAITTNNPECHLMVVLVDERPEEVTDMQRSVKGEVIASTFDRRRRTTSPSPSCRSSGPSAWSSSATTWSCCSTRSPASAAPTTWARRPAAASSPVASTRRRSTRRSASSARPATSRTAAR